MVAMIIAVKCRNCRHFFETPFILGNWKFKSKFYVIFKFFTDQGLRTELHGLEPGHVIAHARPVSLTSPQINTASIQDQPRSQAAIAWQWDLECQTCEQKHVYPNSISTCNNAENLHSQKLSESCEVFWKHYEDNELKNLQNKCDSHSRV